MRNTWIGELIFKTKVLSRLTGLDHKIEYKDEKYYLDAGTGREWERNGTFSEMTAYLDGLITASHHFASGFNNVPENILKDLANIQLCNKMDVSGFHEFILTRKGDVNDWDRLIETEIVNLKVNSYGKRHKINIRG